MTCNFGWDIKFTGGRNAGWRSGHHRGIRLWNVYAANIRRGSTWSRRLCRWSKGTRRSTSCENHNYEEDQHKRLKSHELSLVNESDGTIPQQPYFPTNYE